MGTKQIQSGEKVPLKLTAAERKLVVEELTVLDDQCERIVRNTPADGPVMLTLDELDEFMGYVAAEANHCRDRKKQKRLDAVFQKMEKLLGAYTDEAPPQSIKIEDAPQDKAISDFAAQIADFAAKAVIAAEELRIKSKPLEHLTLAPAEREVLLLVPTVSASLKKKLATEKPLFKVAEVVSMLLSLAEDLQDGDARKQVAVLLVAKGLMDGLQEGIAEFPNPALKKKAQPTTKATAQSGASTGTVCQFKITLLGFKPKIWRRIQVRDCTLDELHEHIQTAMGWTNSHLHQFEIKGERYGDPALLDDGFDEFECVDSTSTMISDIVPATGKRFAFKYEYDFGDGWEHQILFEGRPPVEKGKKYPLCLEGERACPPEDIGGVWGYAEFLSAIADPNHEEHESYLEWCGGSFDPERFDPKRATKAMHKGLPDWRRM
jgi:hypothetical protein